MMLPTREDIWYYIRTNLGDTRILDVDTLLRWMKERKYLADRDWVVKQFQYFGSIGYGRYIPGRHRSRTRIEWNKNPRDYPSALPSQPAPKQRKTLSFTIPLLSGATASLSIPDDLSQQDKDRIANYLREYVPPLAHQRGREQ